MFSFQSFPQAHKRTVRIRWLLKSPEETVEQKQQHQNRYKDLLIISAPVKDDLDESSSVLCLITLPEDDQSLDTTIPTNEQLTVRIARDGRIIKLDASQLKPNFVSFLNKEIGQKIEEIVHPNDHQKLKIHLKEVIEGQSDAQLTNYRIRLGPECYVHAKVQSRMFCSGVPDEPDFVMAVHEILSDNEIMTLDGGSGMFSGMLGSLQSSSGSCSALGGPLMASVISGGHLSQISPRNGPNSIMNENNSLLPPSSNEGFYNPDVYSELYFDMEPNWIESRPESRTSITSASTTRPSSATAAFSPVAVCPSPLTPYHNSQPSPASISNNTNNNNTIMTNNNLANSVVASNQNQTTGGSGSGSNSSNSFQFSFEEKEKIQEQLQKMQHENSSSDRLRKLLLKSPSSSESSDVRTRNEILKVIVIKISSK